jgi:hypothetical protein
MWFVGTVMNRLIVTGMLSRLSAQISGTERATRQALNIIEPHPCVEGPLGKMKRHGRSFLERTQKIHHASEAESAHHAQ